MPEEKYPTPEVNLLSEDEFNGSVSGKFIKWALTWGRRIIVLTELVVISAFISRFWLDTTVANNNDEIEKKRAVILSMADLEKKYRAILDLVDQAKKIEKDTSVVQIYDQTTDLVPVGVVLSQTNIDKKEVHFGGSCSEEVLSTTVANFRYAAKFSAVTVDRIAGGEKKETVDFSLQARYGQ
jgi:hypothetical protein